MRAPSGCRYSFSCLDCLLPACRYDRPIGEEPRDKRNDEIVELKRSGVCAGNLAKQFGLSPRHVFRITSRS